jgi:hypothetical protein
MQWTRIFCGLSICSLASCCDLKLDVVDRFGLSRPFRITTVSRTDLPSENLLDPSFPGISLSSDKRSISLSHKSVGLVLRISANVNIRTSEAKIVSRDVQFLSCGQKSTIVAEEVAADEDTLATAVIGKIDGCDCSRGLWVRLVPMFGVENRTPWSEADVDRSSCGFELGGQFHGSRHILVLGSKNRAVATKSIDLVSNTRNVLPKLDFARPCSASRGRKP